MIPQLHFKSTAMKLLPLLLLLSISVKAQEYKIDWLKKSHQPQRIIIGGGPDSLYLMVNAKEYERLQYNVVDLSELQTLRLLNDSLQKKLQAMTIYFGLTCPIIEALNLTSENKFQFKRAELAKRYRLYLEYYQPEYINNARKRQRR